MEYSWGQWISVHAANPERDRLLMDSWLPDERRVSVDDVVEFIRKACWHERHRQDIEALFDSVSEIDDLDLGSQCVILSHVRDTIARAVLEERRSAAKLASQAPKVLLWVADADKRRSVAATTPAAIPAAMPESQPGRPQLHEMAPPVPAKIPLPLASPGVYDTRSPGGVTLAAEKGLPASGETDADGLSDESERQTRRQEQTVMVNAVVDRLFDETVGIQSNIQAVGTKGSSSNASSLQDEEEDEGEKVSLSPP